MLSIWTPKIESDEKRVSVWQCFWRERQREKEREAFGFHPADGKSAFIDSVWSVEEMRFRDRQNKEAPRTQKKWITHLYLCFSRSPERLCDHCGCLKIWRWCSSPDRRTLWAFRVPSSVLHEFRQNNLLWSRFLIEFLVEFFLVEFFLELPFIEFPLIGFVLWCSTPYHGPHEQHSNLRSPPARQTRRFATRSRALQPSAFLYATQILEN